MNIKKSIVLSAFVTALCFPLAGLSQTTTKTTTKTTTTTTTKTAKGDVYIGGGFGVASHPDGHPALPHIDDLCGDDYDRLVRDYTVTDSTTYCEDSVPSFKIYIGKEFNKNFAVELGYADLGESLKDETITDSNGRTGFVADTSEFSSLYAAAVLMLPVSESVDLFAKVGVHSWDSNLKVESNIFGRLGEAWSVSTTNFTESGSDLLYGGGLQWTSASGFGWRGEWENFGIEVDDTSEDTSFDIPLFSVSVYKQF